MAYLRAKDTVNGALGTCYARIDGERHELMQVKNVTATVKKTRTEIPILGLTGKQHKSGGWEGTGKMTVYYVSSLFRKVMLDYMKNGVDTYFELMLTNEDPTGETGKQTVLLKDVNIDEMVIGKLDVDQFALEEDMTFTFGDADLLDAFDRTVRKRVGGREKEEKYAGSVLQRKCKGFSGKRVFHCAKISAGWERDAVEDSCHFSGGKRGNLEEKRRKSQKI